jgi:hypothetical protein
VSSPLANSPQKQFTLEQFIVVLVHYWSNHSKIKIKRRTNQNRVGHHKWFIAGQFTTGPFTTRQFIAGQFIVNHSSQIYCGLLNCRLERKL